MASCASERSDAKHSAESRHDRRGNDPYGVPAITVVWKLRYYVVGLRSPTDTASLIMLEAADAENRTRIDGFLMEIVSPPEYAGKVLMAHFDGAGVVDPFTFYTLGKHYTEQVPITAIGRIAPTLCR